MSQKPDEQQQLNRVPTHNEPNRYRRQQQQNDPVKNYSMDKTDGIGSTKLCVNNKNLSPTFRRNFKRNGPTTSAATAAASSHFTTPISSQAAVVFGNKTRNNIGHKASQTKRIQLSTAAKRCKSMNRSSAADNNNSKSINLDDICKADDDDDNCVAPISTVDNHSNSISTIQSTESPTLVKVKAWYTDTVTLPTPEVIF